MLVAPGIAIVDLLTSAHQQVLPHLIEDNLFKLLMQVNPELVTADRPLDANVLDHLIDPLTVLSKPQQRDLIIDLLPLAKAKELADRLTVPIDKNLYTSVKTAASKPAARSILESFFGVVRKPTVARSEQPTKGNLEPRYGLYDHQRNVVTRVEENLKSEPYKVVLHMPTGSGKTRTSMHIVANHLRGKSSVVVCWLAYSAELLEQAASELENAWKYLGDRPLEIVRFWGNRNIDLLKLQDGVVVAGLGKLHAIDKRDPHLIPVLADRTSLIIIDEAHQSIAPTYKTILNALYSKQPKNALLGLTATPGRTWSDISEDRKLSDYFDRRKVTLEIKGFSDPIKYLIEQGYLAKTKFHRLEGGTKICLSPNDQKNLVHSVDVPKKVLNMLGRDVNRNTLIVNKIKDLMRRHHRTLVFTPSVESALAISSVLSIQGIDAQALTGRTPLEKRESIIERFRTPGGPPRVLLNFGVLTTGFDAPRTSAALIARPTKSLVLYSQMVGRATRGKRVNGNTSAEIVTVVDTSLPGFGSISQAFTNWEDVWNDK